MRKYWLPTFLFLVFATLPAFPPQFGYHIDLGVLDHEPVTEASGIAASHQNTGVFWTHNDSGDESRLYAFNDNGDHLGVYTLYGVNARDWEDIALGPGPDPETDYIYIGDIGDNGLQNEYKYVYRLPEPAVSAYQEPVDELIEEFEIITLVYPQGAYYDAETLMIDPLTKDLYIVTKRNQGEHDLVFRAAYPQSTSEAVTLTEIAVLDYPSANGYGAVAGDISSSGLEILIKTYQEVYYWSRAIGESIEEAFDQDLIEVNYDPEPQGEALCWKPDGTGYYTVSEEPQVWLQAHLYLYPRLSSFIAITDLPTDLYKQDDFFLIEWLPEDLECELYFSTSPGGEEFSNYQPTGFLGTGLLETTPSELNWGTGVYFCLLHNQEYNYLSNEFQIIVESSNAVVMVSPENGSVITESTPVFSWEPNPGVPYYFVVLSDNPFTIEEDENGDPVVIGLQPVWQIITPNTSALYGIPDPSGFFENVAQPLIPGIEYNWIVANNYGNDPLLTSKVVSAPFGFVYDSPNTIPAPVLLSPANGAQISSEMIVFEWSQVEEASDYQIFLYETREENGNIGNYLIWDQITTNSYYEFNAQAILINADYVWKVIASSPEGMNSVSENFDFHYEIEVGTLNLDVYNIYGSPIGFATAELDPLEGSSDNVPFAVNAEGHEEKIIPTGVYMLTCSKEGYESADTMVTILEDLDLESSAGDTFVDMYLDYSPCNVYGSIVDQEGFPVENATLSALRSDGELRMTLAPGGSYTIGLLPGIWTFSADASGYNLTTEIQQNLLPGENIELDDLIMTSNQKDVEGYTRDENGQPLIGVLITAVKNGITRQVTSNSNGYFLIENMNLGQWTFTAEKDGYISPQQLLLEIMAFSPDLIVLDDLVLVSYANLVLGRATNSVVGMEDVLIKATPQSGSPVTDYTDVYGYYTLNLPTGVYQVDAFFEGFTAQNSYQLSLDVGQTADNIDFVLLPNNSVIEGHVYYNNNGLEGARISAGLAFTYSGANGFYQLPVPSGTYEVTASKQGFSGGNAQTVSLNPGQTVSGVDFNLVPNASLVSGLVQHSGQPIPNALVKGIRLQTGNPINSQYSDDNGFYQLDLNVGSYLIWAEKTGYICEEGDTLSINLGPGQELTGQNIELTPYQVFLTGTTFRTDGSVLRSVTITAVNQDDPEESITTVSGSSGNYNMILRPLIDYGITASKTGYLSDQVELPAQEPDTSYQQNFYLEPLPSQISGKIYDEFGVPLIGALIEAVNDEQTFSAVSALNGYYELALSYGDFDLTVSKLGYLEENDQIYLNPGSQLTGWDYYLEENFGGIYGHIFDTNTGEPVPQAMITAGITSRSTAFSDLNGFYELSGLLPGIYDLTVTKSLYEEENLENIVVPGGFSVEVDVEITPLTSSLNVHVFESENRGLAGVTVSAENLQNGNVTSSVTDNNGNCTLNGLMSEVELLVSAVKLNYFAPDTLVILAPDQTLELDFEMELVNSILAGTVRDPLNSTLNGVQVSAVSDQGFSGNGTTGQNGQYQINNLAPYQYYTVSAVREGYSTPGDTIVYLDQSYNELDLLMYPNDLVISGRIVDQEGIPLAEIPVEAISDLSGQDGETDADGFFTLNGLAPFTEYVVSTSVYLQGYENANLEVYLDDQDLDIGDLVMLVHLSGLTGYITDANTGESLQGADLTAYNNDTGNSYYTTSQPDGYYSLSYLYAGNFDLQISRESYASLETGIQLLHREIINQDFSLQYTVPVSVSGNVRDTDNRPIAEVPVRIINNTQTLSDTTGAQGEYQITGVLPYTQNLLSTDLPPLLYDNYVTGIDIDTSDINQDLLIDIHSAGVSGIVSNTMDEPVQGAQVILSGADFEEEYITPSDGSYEFEYLYEGDYQIEIIRAGYLEETENITLTDFQEVVLDFQLEFQTGDISGLVSNSLGDFLKNAVVIAYDSNGTEAGSDTTSAGGSFSITGLIELDSYSVAAEKTGYLSYQYPDSVEVDTQDLEMALIPLPNSVLGTVFYQDAEVPGSKVKARNLQGFETEVTADQFGDYRISNLAGYYDVWATAQDTLVSYPQSVLITGGQSEIVDLELLDSATISGNVLYNDSGKPGVTVYAVNLNSGRTFSDITDLNGFYQLAGLTPGSYFIDLVIEGFQVIDPPPQQELDEGEQLFLPDIHLTFIENSIAGTVFTDENREGISGAVVTISQEQTVLDSIITAPNGTYIFTGLPDGEYTIEAFHFAYYPGEPRPVVLLNGISDPPTVDFLLEPIELTIFGYVSDEVNNPLAEVIVSAIAQSPPYHVFSDTTSTSGNYAVTTDTTGIFLVSAEKEGYYPSPQQQVELSFDNNSFQQNFILTPIPQFAVIQGSVMVYDEVLQDSLPVAQAFISLEGSSGYLAEVNLEDPDQEYQFYDVPVPDIYSLEIEAQYQDESYYEFRPGIVVNESDTLDQNFIFQYSLNTVNLSGIISIVDEQTMPIPGSEITLFDSTGTLLNTTYTNDSGFYQFSNLTENIYTLDISAQYGNEEFTVLIEDIPWTGYDLVVDYLFYYILSRIDFQVSEDGSFPVLNAAINLQTDGVELNLLTDENGYATTGNVLNSAIYSVTIDKDFGSRGRFIEPLSYNLVLDSLGFYEQNRILPLQFDTEQITALPIYQAVDLNLYKAPVYQDPVFIHYLDVNSDYNEIQMQTVGDTLLTVQIPAQNTSGSLEFWFSSYYEQEGLTYTNSSNPFQIEIYSEGILDGEFSYLTPENPIFVFNQEAEFEVNCSDDNGNGLNELVDAGGAVEWLISDPALGTLIQDEEQIRKAVLYTSADNTENLEGYITAWVSLDNTTIELTEPVKIMDMTVDHVLINGPEEVHNLQVVSYSATVVSNLNINMSIPVQWQDPDPFVGELSPSGNRAYLDLADNFIGTFPLQVTATDPNYGIEVEKTKSVTCYQRINDQTSAGVLVTGMDSKVILYDQMLDTLQVQQARLYYNHKTVSPYQQAGTSNEVISSIFSMNSNRIQENFDNLPGLIFLHQEDPDPGQIYIAYWDRSALEWFEAGSGQREEMNEFLLDHVPLLSADYGLIAPSRSLGLYDLQLRPNPFTPYDMIGENMGLQIEFRLSSRMTRYPRITVRIYTVNGDLVRTIVHNLPMLKGTYQAGEKETLYWDGRTEDGSMAANGRYVIQLIAEDISRRRELVKTVILIK